MRILVESFRGEVPRLTPRALPPNAAQRAVNCRLQSGDLQAWRQFLEIQRLPQVPRTIYLLNDAWLSWQTQVDVARSLIPGDNTFRIYLTGPDEYAQPRWTNYSLATSSPGGAYPVTTRPVGVPEPDEAPTLTVGVDPTPTTFSVDVLDEGDSLSSDWIASPTIAGVSAAAQEASVGNPAPCYSLLANNNPGNPAYIYRNFGIRSAAAVSVSFDWSYQAGATDAQILCNVMTDSSGAGIQVRYDSVQARFSIAQASGFRSLGASTLVSATVSPLLSHSTWYRVEVDVSVDTTANTQTVVARLYQDSALLYTIQTTNAFQLGDYVGFAHESSDSSQKAYYDNILVQASGSSDYVAVNLATSYVFTHVNDLGEESAPSPVSATITRPDGVAVTVTMPGDVPSGVSADYGIEAKRIYRAATGATGTIFRFVAEVSLGTTSYVDTLGDEDLGEELESEGWALPPDDLEGILALPNGIMVGFRRNQLCFSAQNRPHAWPLAYRLTTDTDIVAIGAIDTTVVVGTKSFPYLAQGASPESYSMSKLEVAQACVSKRGLAYLIGIGVAFPSPDGLIAIAGTGQARNLTAGVFTRKQWQALRPETIVAVQHDDTYHFWFDPGLSGEPRTGYMLDLKQDGAGVIELAYHASCAYSDPLTDALYLVLNECNEPGAAYLPQPSTQPDPDGQTIYQFDGDEDALMTYLWRGKLNLLPEPATPQMARLQAEDFDNVLLLGYGDGSQHFEHVGSSDDEFTLPTLDLFDTYELEVIGTSTVRRIQAAETIEEID